MLSWLTNLANYLGNWMQNPWLFLAGVALLAAPIVIHLWNKRKFRTVDWAAIDFLLEADKRNRKRIRLENWLLLLLRCLAVLLLALLLARPFRPQSFAGGALQSVRFERIVMLDDSLSMRATRDGRSPFDVAKQTIVDLVNGLRSVEADETFTLVRMSRPERPFLSGVQLSESTIGELVRDIQSLAPADGPVRLEDALLELEKQIRVEPEYVNRVIYLVSDLQARDWDFSKSERGRSARETLDRIARKAVGCLLVDAGFQDSAGNLAVTEVLAKDKVLVAGVASTFEVTVANHGQTDVRDVPVSFRAGDSIPRTERIERIAANSSATVPFTFTFAAESTPGDPASRSSLSDAQYVAIRANLATGDQSNVDQLPDDNERLLARRIEPGIQTLIVDGDPSAAQAKAESFALMRSLSPPGEQRSGVAARVVTDVELETLQLSDYHVVYLCNLHRLSDRRRASLEAWVHSGGGLVIYVGDQIDEHVYNDSLHPTEDGGLLPARLTTVLGDESEEKWVHFEVNNSSHPALNVFSGDQNPFASWVKVFRWWGLEVDQRQQASGDVLVSARFSDPRNSPAVVEKKLGAGRVVLIATTADRDWNNWPLDPSFVIFSQELTRYIVNRGEGQTTLTVGQSIRHPLNLTEYKLDASLLNPKKNLIPLQPEPWAASDAGERDETQWMVEYAGADVRGIYELNLLRSNGAAEKVIFAANVDVTESDLRRVDMAELRRNLGDAPVQLVGARNLTASSALGAEAELWPLILCLAVVALCCEQTLGWLFGRGR